MPNVGQSTQTVTHVTSHIIHHLISFQLSRKTDSGTSGKQGKGKNTINAYEGKLVSLKVWTYMALALLQTVVSIGVAYNGELCIS